MQRIYLVESRVVRDTGETQTESAIVKLIEENKEDSTSQGRSITPPEAAEPKEIDSNEPNDNIQDTLDGIK